MKLPEHFQPYFPSYDVSKLDSQADRQLIVTSILNFGDTPDLYWLFQTYRLVEILGVVENPSRGTWTRQALNYWQLILGVTVERAKVAQAIMDAEPRPEVYSPIFD